jgi:hypothetical protein
MVWHVGYRRPWHACFSTGVTPGPRRVEQASAFSIEPMDHGLALARRGFLTVQSISTHLTASGGCLLPIHALTWGPRFPLLHTLYSAEKQTPSSEILSAGRLHIRRLCMASCKGLLFKKIRQFGAQGLPLPVFELPTSLSLLLCFVAAEIRGIYQLLEVGRITDGRPESADTHQPELDCLRRYGRAYHVTHQPSRKDRTRFPFVVSLPPSLC